MKSYFLWIVGCLLLLALIAKIDKCNPSNEAKVKWIDNGASTVVYDEKLDFYEEDDTLTFTKIEGKWKLSEDGRRAVIVKMNGM